jgi:isopentenyl diphosphate isomerase/L-lactate dehydrogenase-like FMN-dependent dehydrogenase
MSDWKQRALAALGPTLFGYLRGRAFDSPGAEIDPNEEALQRYRLVPRVLAGQTEVHLECSIMGRSYAAPVGVGAFAADRLFGVQGAAAIGRVCARLRLPFFVSEEAVTPLAEITASGVDCWLQLRAAGPVERAERLLDLAARADCKGIVLTVLAPVHPVPGLHPGGVDVAAAIASRGWSTIGSAKGVARLPAFPAWGTAELARLVGAVHERGMSLIIKGVLHPADALLAQAASCDGVMVSNVGVRQLYRWAPAVERIAPVSAVLEGTSVLVDGGFRTAADIVVARLLGAHMAVMVRPVAYALAAGGEAAVEQMLGGLLGELRAVCAWMGVAGLEQLEPSQLIRLD